jgi:dihydroorotase
MPISRVMALMSTAPAQLVNLSRAGSLAPGKWADIVIFDPAAEWPFDSAKALSKSKNTPFDGATMLGKVRATIVAGRVVFESLLRSF